MLWVMTQMTPILRLMMMDWVAIFMMCGAMFILLFVFGISGASKQYDTLAPGVKLIEFIQRDGTVIELEGKRIFAGESFLDVPAMKGVIEDFGKDCNLLRGRKKIRLGLENLNYTPDPRYFSLTTKLYQLGFDDSDDLFAVLDIPNMDPVRDRVRKAFYLERMAQVYWNMTHEAPCGGKRLVEVFKRRKDNNTVFGRRRSKIFSGETPRKMETRREPSRDTKSVEDELDKRFRSD